MPCWSPWPSRCWTAPTPAPPPGNASRPGPRPMPSPCSGPVRRSLGWNGWRIPVLRPSRWRCAPCAASFEVGRPPSDRTRLSAVPTLIDVLRDQTDLGAVDVEWLLLSALSFAGWVVWVAATGGGWYAAAHVRPTTGPMVFFEDVFGRRLDRGRRPMLDQAFSDLRIVRERDPEWRDDMPIREEAIPVVSRGHALAVLTRHTNLATMRTPSRLDLIYLATADALARMIAAGEFPTPGR